MCVFSLDLFKNLTTWKKQQHKDVLVLILTWKIAEQQVPDITSRWDVVGTPFGFITLQCSWMVEFPSLKCHTHIQLAKQKIGSVFRLSLCFITNQHPFVMKAEGDCSRLSIKITGRSNSEPKLLLKRLMTVLSELDCLLGCLLLTGYGKS